MPLQLVSTRDPSAKPISLKEAILTSQPPDGGLFTFPKFPQIGEEDLKELQGTSYQDLAKCILGKFDFDMAPEELEAIIDDTYGSQWDSKLITPLTHFDGNSSLLELHHGPTKAFKDVALQFLPRVLSKYRTRGQVMRALGASSGDTISAAHYGVGGVEGLRSIFLLPANGPSEIQRLQSTAHGFANAITILIEGSFDDGQRAIKRILSSPDHAEFKEENNFISFNSINIARILAQVVYYFSAYLQMIDSGKAKMGDKVDYSVPSGNFGDALAGVYAREMGLPVGKICVATNSNDVLHRFLETGKYEPAERSVITRAPSQDITRASNFERMIYLTVRDPMRVTQLMQDLDQQGSFEVTEAELAKMKEVLVSSTATDEEIDMAILNTAKLTKRYIDPHTATGIIGSARALPMRKLDYVARTSGMYTHMRIPNAGHRIHLTPTICLATASHVKFDLPEGEPGDLMEYEQIMGPLRDKPEVFLRADADEAAIVHAIRAAVKQIEESLKK
jgi:threonine synthase